MAVVVTPDYLGDGNAGTATWDSQNGYRQTRMYLVAGLETGTTAERQMLAMIYPGVPAMYTPHPSSGFAISVVSKSCAVVDPKTFLVSVNYGTPRTTELPPDEVAEHAIVSVSTVLIQVETAFDYQSNQIYTEYNDGARVYGSVTAFHASTEVRYQRHEENSPGQKARDYVGTLNADENIFGDPAARTWMCSEISGHSDNGGDSYIVNYAFLRSPHSKWTGSTRVIQPWDPTIVEIDPLTGNFVEDPTFANSGKKTVKVQGETTWSGLNLTLT